MKQVGRELGVRYVLEGSVRKAANRVRITGQLIDAATGAHLWADRFDGALEDIFDLQDQVTASVVGAIAPKLEQAEIERAKRKPTESLDAYDYYLARVWRVFISEPKEANRRGAAAVLQGHRARSRFCLGLRHGRVVLRWRKINGWMTNRAQEIAEGDTAGSASGGTGSGRRGRARDGRTALAFVVGDLDDGVAVHRSGSRAQSELGDGMVCSAAWLRVWLGEPEVAIEHVGRAMRLSPLDPIHYHMQVGTAFAHFFAGRYDEASSWADKAFQDQPNYLPAATHSAASHALAGRHERSTRSYGARRQIDPALRISNLKDWFPVRRPEDFSRWEDGMRKAGLPE